MKTINMKASADVGNSTTKIIVIDGVSRKARIQPTLAAYLPTIPKFEDDEISGLVANLHKNIVVHITSPSIARGGLYAIGDIASVYDGSGFNIKRHKKANRDITIIQPLAMVAAAAIQSEYEQNNKMPMSLVINLEYATAIPVVDYSKADARFLEDRLTGSHILVVYIGEGLNVHVTINVTATKVVQEGIPALYAIAEAGETMFAAYNKRYNVNFTGRDFADRKLLFVDIGDGTTELIFIDKGKPIVTKSGGIRAGVGHASEMAIAAFKDKHNIEAEINRSKFMKKVLDTKDTWHVESVQELKLSTYDQEEKLFDKIVDVIENKLDYDLDDVVVFGGGTNVFKSLKNRLIDFTNSYKMRVLWITGKESALLNTIGLDELNQKVFFKK